MGGWRQNIDGVDALLTPPLYEGSYVHMDLDGRENIWGQAVIVLISVTKAVIKEFTKCPYVVLIFGTQEIDKKIFFTHGIMQIW